MNYKTTTLTLCAVMLLSSCGVGNENTASGGFLGAQLGSILGSAIGGISGGPRGSDIGTVVGMAGGAVVGAAVGSAADKARRDDIEARSLPQRRSKYSDMQPADSYSGGSATQSQDASGFDPSNGGDDIISFDSPAANAAPADAHGNAAANAGGSLDDAFGQPLNYSAGPSTGQAASFSAPALEIRSVRFAGKDNDLTLRRGEMAKVVVEVYNNSPEPLYNVQPFVEETTGNKHIFVSAPIVVEKINPGKGIRYTAMVKADSKLKDGNAHFKVVVREAAHRRSSEPREFDIATKRE